MSGHVSQDDPDLRVEKMLIKQLCPARNAGLAERFNFSSD
jgi:hypothetical protein